MTPEQLTTLVLMLSYCRPHGSGGDHLFRAEFLHDLPGIVEDEHGNLIVRIGDSPILWSSHTDTVHNTSGFQTIRVSTAAGTIRLSRKARRVQNCLGADDTVGVFLMREMILANVPGLYIFHYGEESGCIGSGALAWKTPETLEGIKYAIALDRAGTADVITSQSGGTCCSDLFAYSLAQQLPGQYVPARGIYTDTAEYIDLIPECTNISVGYYNQHSRGEYVDYFHVARLLPALCSLDPGALICARDPHARTSYYPVVTARHDPDFSDLDNWCFACEAPIIAEDVVELMLHRPEERCMCHEVIADVVAEYTDPDDYDPRTYQGMSEDDKKFLRYLRSR